MTKTWAVKYGINIQWLFTEAGHGKSAADGIGGNIKNLVKDKLAFNTQYTIKTMEDVVKLIEQDTTIELLIHTKDDVQKVANSLPVLSSLTGALKIHELLFDRDGQVLAKNLPTDPFYFDVNIRVSRKKAVQAVNEGDISEDASENEE